jgi:trimeric autotransporter adhesin
MRKLYLAIGLLICASSAFSQSFTLVKDIITGNTGSITDAPWESFQKNGILYLSATDATHGDELWRTDGTDAGTWMVKDCNPGVGNSGPGYLTSVGSNIFFRAGLAAGPGLWKTDGTEAGTVLVKQFVGNSNTLRYFTNVNGVLFFIAYTSADGTELWKSDGTELGTVMVKNIRSGSQSSDPLDLVNFNGTLYFSAVTASAGRELWKSDGTDAGTVMVKEFTSGPSDGNPGALLVANNTLYFSANNGASLQRLWKSDGTAAGTVLLKDVSVSDYALNSQFTYTNNLLFFRADDGVNGAELWKSDGTTAGTVMVKNINPSGTSNILSIKNIGSLLIFSANDGVNGNEVWRSDGTDAGTYMIKNVGPGAANGYGSVSLVPVGDKIAFVGNDGVNGAEPWITNGTDAGTKMVQDYANGTGPVRIAAAADKLFLSFQDVTVGRELWVATIPADAPLPLTLVDIKGQLSGNDGLLTWKTVSEENVSHFEIERSTDNRRYSTIGSKAAANSSGVNNYSFTDFGVADFTTPVVFYRLKMKDIDGKSVYSKVIAINLKNMQAVVMLYPNPVKQSTTLMISVLKKEKLTYSIIDQQGRVVSQQNIVANEGSNLVSIETTGLSTGSYTISITGTVSNTQLKFIKN